MDRRIAMTRPSIPFRFGNVAAASAACLALSACQTAPPAGGSSSAPTTGAIGITASAPKLFTRSGFLSDYERLALVADSDGTRCWGQAGVDWKQYHSVMIARMAVTLKPGQISHVDPTDLKALLDYFHDALAKALAPQLKVVDSLGSGVIVMRIALTDLTPTNVAGSVLGTAIPYGYVLDVSSGVATGLPAGATPYLGETGIEAQFRDGDSNSVLAECEDTEVGRKYAADLNSDAAGAAHAWVGGYLNSFSTWAYARNAFDKWAALAARRIAALRAS
jgi:hypothetical protein